MKIKFNAIQWMQRQHRFKDFPFHGKAKVILNDGDEITIKTGNSEMYNIRIYFGWAHRLYGHNVTGTLKDAAGNEYDFNAGMYMTRNNQDPHKANAGQTKWGKQAHDQLPFNTEVTFTVSRPGGGPIKVLYAGSNLVK